MSPHHETQHAYRRFAKNRLKELGWGVVFTIILGASHAHAVSLSDIRVNSTLGQPLDAVIHVTAAPGEVLTANCFSTPPPSAGALPRIPNVRLSLARQLTPGTLRLTTRQAVREPLNELVLQVRCPGVPNFSRTFMVMIDPPEFGGNAMAAQTDSRDAAPRADASRSLQATRQTSRRNDSDSRQVISADSSRIRIHAAYAGPTTPILPGNSYTVRNGDVLSMIAARVEGRPSNTVWQIAERIFAANPAAFIGGDPDMLIAGTQVFIPALSDTAVSRQAAPAPPASPLAAARTNIRPTVPTVATTVAPAPAAIGLPPQPLPTMVLSRALSDLSVNRLALRRAGVLQVAPPPKKTAATNNAATRSPATPATTTVVSADSAVEALRGAVSGNKPATPGLPSDESRPERVAAAPKTALPANPVQSPGSSLGWLLFLALAVLVVIGAPLAALMLKRRVQRVFRHDMRQALRRRRYADELRRSRQQREMENDDIVVHESARIESSADASMPASFGSSLDMDLPHLPEVAPVRIEEPSLSDEMTMEMQSPSDSLDLEFPEMSEEMAAIDGDEREPTLELETAEGVPELDLELPDLFATTAASDKPAAKEPEVEFAPPDGMEELDFDPELLALDYSKEYEASRKAISDEQPDGETSSFYHLEAGVEDDDDDVLSFESDDDEEDTNIVRFPKKLGGS